MLESRVLRYCLYGSCVILSSEILYHSYFWIKNLLKEDAEEVHEVIWTNELTQTCTGQHRFIRNCNVGNAITSPTHRSPSSKAGMSRLSQGHSVKTSSTIKENCDACRNPFCPTYNIGRLIEFIDSAKYSIDLAMYTFTSYEVSQAFGRAFQRGVFIRIISDQEMAYSSGSQIIPLTKMGVPVRCNRNANDLMHHKFCIIDEPTRVVDVLKKQNRTSLNNKVRSLLMTGSLNWTNQGFGYNWENILITSNPKYINKYSQEFERLWKVFENVID